jgi:hypothetical protein
LIPKQGAHRRGGRGCSLLQTIDFQPQSRGPSSFVTKAKETLTDKNGEFFFPSYSELMYFNEDVGARFIFFKPGYQAGYGPTYISPI